MKDQHVYVYSNNSNFKNEKVEADKIYIYNKELESSLNAYSVNKINLKRGLKIINTQDSNEVYYLNQLFSTLIVYNKEDNRSDIMISVNEKDFKMLSGKEYLLVN